jgi:ATPase subunit of ABC transporter with duplicated ATPase domains
MFKYAVVWLDYTRALFFHVHPDRFDESTIWIQAHETTRHAEIPNGPSVLDQQRQFFEDVAGTLRGAEEVLVVGPTGAAKLELVQYIHAHDTNLAQHIIGLETVEHANGSQLVECARRYFVPTSMMR